MLSKCKECGRIQEQESKESGFGLISGRRLSNREDQLEVNKCEYCGGKTELLTAL